METHVSKAGRHAITVRLARASDKDGVLGECSNGIFNGHDYLPKVWDEWMADPSRVSFVAVDSMVPENGSGASSVGSDGVMETCEQCVVGFESVGSFDHGRTRMMQGLRVSPRYRGKGVAKLLGASARAEMARSGAERLRVTSFCKEPDGVTDNVSFMMHLAQGYTDIARFSLSMFSLCDRRRDADGSTMALDDDGGGGGGGGGGVGCVTAGSVDAGVTQRDVDGGTHVSDVEVALMRAATHAARLLRGVVSSDAVPSSASATTAWEMAQSLGATASNTSRNAGQATASKASHANGQATTSSASDDAGQSAFPGNLVFHDWAVSDATPEMFETLERDHGYIFAVGAASVSMANITQRMSGAHLYVTVHGGISAEEIIGHFALAIERQIVTCESPITTVVVLWDRHRYDEVRRVLETTLEGFVFDTHYTNHCVVLEKLL